MAQMDQVVIKIVENIDVMNKIMDNEVRNSGKMSNILEDVVDKIGELVDITKTLTDRIDQLEKQVDDLEDDVEILEEEVEDLQEENMSKEKDIEELCNEVVSSKNDDDFIESYLKLTEVLKAEVREDIKREEEMYGEKPYDDVEYGNKEQKIVTCGMKDGINFWILNMQGNFPCAYVKVPEDHPWYKLQYDELNKFDIDVHGGVTYSDDHLSDIESDCWIIGWDYTHYGDYHAEIQTNGKKWTTDEILEDIRRAINALNNVSKKEPTIEFVDWTEKNWAWCGSDVTIKFNGKEITLKRPLMSGGSVWFDDDWREHVEDGPWSIRPSALPDELKEYVEEISKVINDNIPYGCCGGCV